MQNVITLRGAVLSKYRTIGDFAKDIGWQRGKASRILNGTQDPDVEDITQMAQILGIEDRNTFVNLFFAPLSTMWTTE